MVFLYMNSLRFFSYHKSIYKEYLYELWGEQTLQIVNYDSADLFRNWNIVISKYGMLHSELVIDSSVSPINITHWKHYEN